MTTLNTEKNELGSAEGLLKDYHKMSLNSSHPEYIMKVDIGPAESNCNDDAKDGNCNDAAKDGAAESRSHRPGLTRHGLERHRRHA